ncbi:Uncharacterised protein [Cedecea neteri]|uniref:Uncharacterized protein n=1 Tax=Cedecea neteri TaxID=158822 RepID=A0A2X3JET3_9ENTR|nr:Uncharacterised protein [Cedecea neteri]
MTPKQRDKLEKWLNSTVLPLGGAGMKLDIIYVGSILHYDSVLSRTMKNPSWNARRFQAIPAWPENMDLWDEWEELLRTKGKAAAKAYYRRREKAMLRGARVSWAARPLLELMLIRVAGWHPRVRRGIPERSGERRERHLPRVHSLLG